MGIEPDKVFAVWLREVKRFTNSKPRMVASLGTPLLFLIALGAGIGPLVTEFNYIEFIFPGIIGMTLLFNSMFSGVSIIWDRELGFLKEMLVAPTSRANIVLGRTFGGATNSFVQGTILLALGIVFGLAHPPILGIILALIVMFLFACIIVSLGIAIASIIQEVETFQLIINLVVMPLFFLSNALFPIEKMPQWLGAISTINPVSYGVDSLRFFVSGTANFPIALDIGLLIVFFAAITGIAITLFNKTAI